MKNLLAFLLMTVSMQTAFAGGVSGGISGGGGGTIVPDPAGTEFIKLQLSGARVSLLMFLKNMKVGKERPELFQGKENILEKIKQYSLKIETDKACLDFDGQPNDGSINSDPNTICLSAFTIGQKVSMVTAYPQLLALMAHEYSHLMGYDEKAAVLFQTDVLYMAKSVSESDGRSIGIHFTMEAQAVWTWLNNAQAEISRNHPEVLYGNMQRADNAVLFPSRYPFRALDENEANFVGEIAIRIKNLRLYACSQFETTPGARDLCSLQYDQLFNNADEISAADFNLRYYGDTSLQPSGAVPNLAQNPSRLATELQDLQEKIRQVSATIDGQLNLRD